MLECGDCLRGRFGILLVCLISDLPASGSGAAWFSWDLVCGVDFGV